MLKEIRESNPTDAEKWHYLCEFCVDFDQDTSKIWDVFADDPDYMTLGDTLKKHQKPLSITVGSFCSFLIWKKLIALVAAYLSVGIGLGFLLVGGGIAVVSYKHLQKKSFVNNEGVRINIR